MEGNKDESGRCILIARKCINVGDIEKAIRFLHKAQRLYPTQEAKGNTVCYNNSGLCSEKAMAMLLL